MKEKHYDNIAETLITETLSNGLTINIVPRPAFAKSFAMFSTDYGGADRRFKLGGNWIDTPAGVAHFLEHKMFDMPYGNALSVLSANGASPNAFTSSGITAYHFECTERFEDNLRILLGFVSTPYFLAESVQKEQGIIGQEICMVEDNPGFVLYNNLLRCLYEHNPVRDSVAGSIESISEITDKTLYHCHEVFYSPSNMTLAVVGNADPEKVIAMAREILPKEPGEVPERDYGEQEAATPHQKKIVVEMEVSAPQFLFGARIRPEKDGIARLRQSIIGEIALSMLLGPSSPVFNHLYSNGLLNGSFDYEIDYTAGTAMLLAGGESRAVSTVMDEVTSELRKITADGLDENLFINSKKSYFGDKLRNIGSFSTLGQALSDGAFAGFCPLDAFEIIESITLQDVQAFVFDNIVPEKLALSIIEPKK